MHMHINVYIPVHVHEFCIIIYYYVRKMLCILCVFYVYFIVA